MVGTTNAGPLASVDGRGRIVAVDGAWAVDWWIGADDRWHVPAEEVAVRQRLVDAAPVVETSMRVPGGDAVARAFGARVPGIDADLLALDIANETSIPFALAVVISGRRRVTLNGERAVVDDAAVIDFGRVPSRWAAGAEVAPVRALVFSGEARSTDAISELSPGPVLALLFPLAHTARLRCTVGARPVAPAVPAPTGVTPDADQVARGWRAQLDRGLGLGLPDDVLVAQVDGARADLLLAAGGSMDGASVDELAALVRGLAGQGFGDEAQRVVALLVERQRLNGLFGRGSSAEADTAAALMAVGEYWRATHDRPFVAELAGPVAKAAHRLGRRRGAADPSIGEAVAAAADLLEGIDQVEAAGAVRGLAAFRSWAPAAPAGLATSLDRQAPGAGDDGRYARGACRFLDRVRRGLVSDDPGSDRADRLALFSGFPPSWRDQPLEVHRVPTRFGLVSGAVRWHGDRPALLWDCEPWPADGRDGVPEAGSAGLTVTAPGLDPGWSSPEPSGEALLAPPPDSGDGRPDVSEPPDLQASFS